MRFLALTALVACHALPPPPEIGELVVYQMTEIGDISVSGDTIRWNDGVDPRIVREASLGDIPVGRDAPVIGESRAKFVVQGQTTYLTDGEGVLEVTDGVTRRVVSELGVDHIFLPDGALYWAHTTGLVSWFEAGEVQTSFIHGVDSIVELAVNRGERYAGTIGSRAGQLGLVTSGKLFQIDAAGTATELVDAGQFAFAGEFIDNHEPFGDIYKSRGLYSIDGRLYWLVFDEAQSSEYQQTLIAEVTDDGFPIALPPQVRSDHFFVHDGMFYWNVDEQLWRAAPYGTPELVIEGFSVAMTIADGYIYGYVGVLDTLTNTTFFDLRRVALP
jgi:hypothetical protein